MAQFFFSDDLVLPAKGFALFESPRRNRWANIAQIALLIYVVGANLYGARQGWKEYGPSAPRSELYGIWTVDECTVDGRSRPPLLTDSLRWRRAIFESPRVAAFQLMDDSFVRLGTSFDTSRGAQELKKPGSDTVVANFRVQRPASDKLLFEGTMDGHNVQMSLGLIDHTKFLLVSRGFHWIQEYPFNR